MDYKRCFMILLVLSCVKAALMVFTILHAGIGLGPDEAQYWTWSRQLDWGYYSKPPGIAWQIWLGTQFFGSTELGVRSMAVAIGFVIPLLVFLLAKGCKLSPWGCFGAGAAMALSPLGMMASFLSITDGGMVLFWTAACVCMAQALSSQVQPAYPLIGLLIALGALFKWPIYALWPIILASLYWYPHARSWKILIGIAISLLAILPSVYWNSDHDWVTFRHVLATIEGGHAPVTNKGFFSGNFLDFMGAQALLVSPILFILLVMALIALAKISIRKKVDQGIVFCAVAAMVPLGCAMLLSLFMKIQGNWVDFAYPTAFVVIAWYACVWAPHRCKWLAGGIILSVVLCGMAFSIPYVQSHNLWAGVRIPYRISPFRHNVGWSHLQQKLQEAGYDPSRDFLFGDKYQTASILSFYGEEQHPAYFFNLQGMRKNQFSFWPGLGGKQKGKRGYFIVHENAPKLYTETSKEIKEYEELLSRYFEKVRFLGISPLFLAYGQIVKGTLIFECSGFSGLAPIDPELY